MLYELALTLEKEPRGKEGILSCLLDSLNISKKDIVEEFSKKKTRLLVFLRTSQKARDIARSLIKLKIKKVKILVTPLKNKEWQEKWKETYKPFNITRNVRIVPYWLKDFHKRPTRVTIFIDPGLAFGSGLHPTTKYIAELIELKKGKIESFFDIGTGTGILSCIAGKYGIKTIWSIDFSKDATRAARINLKENSCKADYIGTVDIKKLKKRSKFDFVAANLRTKILIENKRKIVSYVKKGKYLAVSGISGENYKFFRKNFDDRSLKCLKVKRNKDWAAVLYKKQD